MNDKKIVIIYRCDWTFYQKLVELRPDYKIVYSKDNIYNNPLNPQVLVHSLWAEDLKGRGLENKFKRFKDELTDFNKIILISTASNKYTNLIKYIEFSPTALEEAEKYLNNY